MNIKEQRISIENRLNKETKLLEAELRALQSRCPHLDVFSTEPDGYDGSFIWLCRDCNLRKSCL